MAVVSEPPQEFFTAKGEEKTTFDLIIFEREQDVSVVEGALKSLRGIIVFPDDRCEAMVSHVRKFRLQMVNVMFGSQEEIKLGKMEEREAELGEVAELNSLRDYLE